MRHAPTRLFFSIVFISSHFLSTVAPSSMLSFVVEPLITLERLRGVFNGFKNKHEAALPLEIPKAKQGNPPNLI